MPIANRPRTRTRARTRTSTRMLVHTGSHPRSRPRSHAGAALLVAPLLAALVLTGCGEPSAPTGTDGGATSSQEPTGASAPDPAATASSSEGPSSDGPSATGSATAGEQPGEAGETSGPDGAPAELEYCGDALVLAMLQQGGTVWGGDAAQQLEAAQPRPEFLVPDALAGHDVRCTASFAMPIDGTTSGVGTRSVAVLTDAGAADAVAAWAEANGYVAQGSAPYIEYQLAAEGGRIVAKLMATEITQGTGEYETGYLALEHADAVIGDVVVTHLHFEGE